LKKTEQ